MRKNKGKPSGAPTTAPRSQTFEPDETAKKQAKAELNLLAQMVGGGGAATHTSSGAEKINIASLFPDARE